MRLILGGRVTIICPFLSLLDWAQRTNYLSIFVFVEGLDWVQRINYLSIYAFVEGLDWAQRTNYLSIYAFVVGLSLLSPPSNTSQKWLGFVGDGD